MKDEESIQDALQSTYTGFLTDLLFKAKCLSRRLEMEVLFTQQLVLCADTFSMLSVSSHKIDYFALKAKQTTTYLKHTV